MYYTIYKTTNLINNKIYIGKHKTEDPNDDYMGSGKHFKRAELKYGTENFKKEVLFVFDTEEEMNQKEKELVTEDFIKLDSNYNICPGGKGGWGYVNAEILTFEKRSINGKISGKIKTSAQTAARKKGIKYAFEFYRKKYPNGADGFLGKKHSDETKALIGLKNSISQSGEKNSQFGTMWITNDLQNKKIKSNEKIPINWKKGRIIPKLIATFTDRYQ